MTSGTPCESPFPPDDDIADMSDLPPEVVMNIDHRPATRTIWQAFDDKPALRDLLLDVIKRLERVETLLFRFTPPEE